MHTRTALFKASFTKPPRMIPRWFVVFSLSSVLQGETDRRTVAFGRCREVSDPTDWRVGSPLSEQGNLISVGGDRFCEERQERSWTRSPVCRDRLEITIH